jgi:hypothetical protein
MVESSKRVKN